jgi:hypothetical protein
MGWHGDYDLLREAREDTRRDMPDARQLEQADGKLMDGAREREASPVGTWLARKAA